MKDSSDGRFVLQILIRFNFRIPARDHSHILRSGIIDFLQNGNGNQKLEENPAKESWQLFYRRSLIISFRMLSHTVLNLFESIMLQLITRLHEGPDVASTQLQACASVINSSAVEMLFSKCFDLIFNQMEQCQKNDREYIIDEVEDCTINSWEFYTNEQPKGENAQEEDKKAEEIDMYSEISNYDSDESKEEADDEEDSDNGGKLNIDHRRNIDYIKPTGYQKIKISKLLRLVEMLSTLAITDENMKKFLLRILNQNELEIFANQIILNHGNHNAILFKIFFNVLQINFDTLKQSNKETKGA